MNKDSSKKSLPKKQSTKETNTLRKPSTKEQPKPKVKLSSKRKSAPVINLPKGGVSQKSSSSNVTNTPKMKSSTNVPVVSKMSNKSQATSVYDKYREQFSKLANNKDIVLKESEEETMVGGEKNKLTPMPQFQKAANSTISKDEFSKAERNAVMMRRMEYNAKIKKKKVKKYNIVKVKLIQMRWRKYKAMKQRRLQKVALKIQSVYRGYKLRASLNKKKNTLIKMIRKLRYKHLKKPFQLFLKKMKRPVTPPKPKKQYAEFGCQAEIEIVVESANEKLADIFTGPKGPGKLHGIKNFPRLRTEIGNNGKMIKKFLLKYNKRGALHNEMQITNEENINLNIPTEYDEEATDIKKKLFYLQRDDVVKEYNPRRTAEERAMSLLKRTPIIEGVNFITKKSIYIEKEKKFIKRKLQVRMMLMMLSTFSYNTVKNYVMDILIKKYYAPYHYNKVPIALFTIEDEFDNEDLGRMEQMKSNFTEITSKSNYLIASEENDTNESANSNND